MIIIRLSFALTLLLATVLTYAEPLKLAMRDGYQLAATYMPAKQFPVAVLFLHQCNRDQSMWLPLARRLSASGLSTLTVDFRGFGISRSAQYDVSESDQAYDQATAFIQQDAIDIYKNWLSLTPGIKQRAIVGASRGGGGAALLASQFKEVKALILFSPSLRTYWFADKYWPDLLARKDLPILGIAARGDVNAMQAVQKVLDNSSAKLSQLIRYQNKLHGEPLFKQDPNIADKMVTWLMQVLNKG